MTAATKTTPGSTQWHNSARSRLALKRDGETNRLTLKQEKLNAKPPLREPISGEFVDGVFEVEKRTEKVERDESECERPSHVQGHLGARPHDRGGGQELADNDHPTTQYKQLSAYSTWPSSKYKSSAGKQLVRQGVSLMKQEGLLEADKGYKNGNEHHTVRLTEQGKAAALAVITGGETLVSEAPDFLIDKESHMKDVVLWLNTEFDRDHFKSHFELWTVNPLSTAEGMGWENRQYMLASFDQKTNWDERLIDEYGPHEYNSGRITPSARGAQRASGNNP